MSIGIISIPYISQIKESKIGVFYLENKLVSFILFFLILGSIILDVHNGIQENDTRNDNNILNQKIDTLNLQVSTIDLDNKSLINENHKLNKAIHELSQKQLFGNEVDNQLISISCVLLFKDGFKPDPSNDYLRIIIDCPFVKGISIDQMIELFPLKNTEKRHSYIRQTNFKTLVNGYLPEKTDLLPYQNSHQLQFEFWEFNKKSKIRDLHWGNVKLMVSKSLYHKLTEICVIGNNYVVLRKDITQYETQEIDITNQINWGTTKPRNTHILRLVDKQKDDLHSGSWKIDLFTNPLQRLTEFQ